MQARGARGAGLGHGAPALGQESPEVPQTDPDPLARLLLCTQWEAP